MNKISNKFGNKLTLLYMLGMLGLLIGYIVLYFGTQTKYVGEITDFSNGWIDSSGSIVELEESSNVDMTKLVPEFTGSKSILIRVHNVNVEVYLDNKLVNDSFKDEMTYSLGYKTPGAYFIFLDLDTEDIGKEIRIVTNTPYSHKDKSCAIKQILYGDFGILVRDIIKSSAIPFYFCSVTIIFGLLFIVLGAVMRNCNDSSFNLILLGVFAVVVSIWSITETKVLQLLFGNSAFWHMVTNCALYMVIPPIFNLYNRKDTSRNPIVTVTVNSVCISVFLIMLILHLYGIVDLHETVLVSHIIMIVGAGITLYYAIKVVVKEPESKENKLSLIGIICIVLCMLVDFILYRAQVTMDNSTLIRPGLLIYLCIVGFVNIREYAKSYNKYLKNEIIAKSAFLDVATGTYNRISYVDDLQKLTFNNRKDVLAVMFDINDLKYINDLYGHSNGDAAIYEAASFIKDIFHDCGKCYRIGGDEFIMLAYGNNNNLVKIQEKANELQEALVSRNELMEECTIEVGDTVLKSWKLLIAVGYASYEDSDTSVMDVIDRADYMMYENKKKLKSENPDMDIRGENSVTIGKA